MKYQILWVFQFFLSLRYIPRTGSSYIIEDRYIMEQSEASIFTLRNFNWVGIYLHINKKIGICTFVNRFIFFKKICLKCAKLNSYLNGLLCWTTPQNTLENISKSSIWAVHSCCLQSQTTCLFMKSRFFIHIIIAVMLFLNSRMTIKNRNWISNFSY